MSATSSGGPPARANKLLAVSWAMPPLLLARSVQVPRILKALAALGWQSTVLHPDPVTVGRSVPRDSSLARIYEGAYKRVPVRGPAIFNALYTSTGLRLSAKFGLGDVLWRRFATKAASSLLDSGDFQVLATFAWPWTDHLIGLAVRRTVNIPWVAHFSDPWVDSPYINKADPDFKIWCAQERAIIRAATAVVFVTKETADLVMKKYPPQWRNKSYVAPQGFDRSFLQLLAPKRTTTRLRIVCAGNFYGPRTPIPFLLAIDELRGSRNLARELEVIFVGQNEKPYQNLVVEKGLSAFVTFRPSVPFLDCLQIQQDADALLVIDAPSAGASVFLPSKLIDYLMFNKPILGVTPTEGATADLLRRVGCPVASPDEVPAIAGALSKLIDDWRAGKLVVSRAFTEVAREYEISTCGATFARILAEAVGRSGVASSAG